MKRREFITLLGGAAAAWPLAARAQQRIAKIGYIAMTSASLSAPYSDAFRLGLRNLGYVEGKDFVIEFRFAEGEVGRLPGLATDLVRLNVDVIVTYGPGVPAAQAATATIPIVMASHSDAVATGLVASLARPGGNVTGSTFFNPELMAKRLELSKELVPSMTQAGVLLMRNNASNGPILQAIEPAAKALNVGLRPFEVGGTSEFESAFTAWGDKQVDAVVIHDTPIFIVNAKLLTALAGKHRLASIGFLEWPASGGLAAYGVNFFDQFRRAAVFVDKIIKGAKPGDIPVEQATKFETIINLKTAKALGLGVPPTLLARADEVIE